MLSVKLIAPSNVGLYTYSVLSTDKSYSLIEHYKTISLESVFDCQNTLNWQESTCLPCMLSPSSTLYIII